MLGSVREGAWDDRVSTMPADGRPTMSRQVVVEDVDGHGVRARAADAEIVTALEDQDYGGRPDPCRDLEGNLAEPRLL